MRLISELESLGLRISNMNKLNDVEEIENLVDNLKQQFIRDYKSSVVFTDWNTSNTKWRCNFWSGNNQVWKPWINNNNNKIAQVKKDRDKYNIITEWISLFIYIYIIYNVVVGTRGMTGFNKMLLGSTALEVVTYSNSTVVVVK